MTTRATLDNGIVANRKEPHMNSATIDRTRTRRLVLWLAAALIGLIATCVLPVPAQASLIVGLSDLNSSAQVDLKSQAGMFEWKVDGQNQLHQQWFWFRVGNTGPERSVDTLTLSSYTVSANLLDATYTGLGFVIDIRYSLIGGSAGSGWSDISEVIRIRNTSGTALDFHFIQYSDFDLLGTAGGETVAIDGIVARQTEGNMALSETSALRFSRSEVDYYSKTLDRLNDALTTNLNNSIGPVGPGDVTWAFQWDANIRSGGSLLISKDKQIQLEVPEPATLVLLALGGIAVLGGAARRGRR